MNNPSKATSDVILHLASTVVLPIVFVVASVGLACKKLIGLAAHSAGRGIKVEPVPGRKTALIS